MSDEVTDPPNPMLIRSGKALQRAVNEAVTVCGLSKVEILVSLVLSHSSVSQ